MKKALFILLVHLFTLSPCWCQSSGTNYIRTRTMLNATGSKAREITQYTDGVGRVVQNNLKR